MTDQDAIAAGGVDRIWKLCKCCTCGIVRKCTPEFDFYTRPEDPEPKPLWCEACLLQSILSKKDD